MSFKKLAATLSRRPPNFHKTASKSVNCDTCEYMNRVNGKCKLFNYPVERDDVCSRWERDGR